jgi:kynureninase
MAVAGLRRADFPALDRFTYLNTAPTGLVAASVVRPAICISHIQYLTGHLLGLAELAALAHAHGATRFSMHFYNNSDDVEHALAVLDEVLGRKGL